MCQVLHKSIRHFEKSRKLLDAYSYLMDTLRILATCEMRRGTLDNFSTVSARDLILKISKGLHYRQSDHLLGRKCRSQVSYNNSCQLVNQNRAIYSCQLVNIMNILWENVVRELYWLLMCVVMTLHTLNSHFYSHFLLFSVHMRHVTVSWRAKTTLAPNWVQLFFKFFHFLK